MFSSRGTVRYEERGQGYRDVEKVGKHCSIVSWISYSIFLYGTTARSGPGLLSVEIPRPQIFGIISLNEWFPRQRSRYLHGTKITQEGKKNSLSGIRNHIPGNQASSYLGLEKAR